MDADDSQLLLASLVCLAVPAFLSHAEAVLISLKEPVVSKFQMSFKVSVNGEY